MGGFIRVDDFKATSVPNGFTYGTGCGEWGDGGVWGASGFDELKLRF
jgi:hypothetical protein